MDLAFWFLVLVLVGGAAAYWWFFMRSNGEGSDKPKEQKGEENRVDLSEDSTAGGATPEQPSSTEGGDQNSGEDTTPSV